MRYHIYWSLLDTPSNSIKSHTILLFTSILTTILWLLIKKYKKPSDNYEKQLLLWSIGGFSILSFFMFSYVRFFTEDKSDEAIKKIIASSNVTEGKIFNFNRQVDSHKFGNVTTESFRVDTIEFKYADYFLGRFNSFSKTNTNILHNGLQVRIRYSGDNNDILQIEIAE